MVGWQNNAYAQLCSNEEPSGWIIQWANDWNHYGTKDNNKHTHILDLPNRKYIIDNIIYNISNNITNSSDGTIYLYGVNRNGVFSRETSMKLWECSIWKNGELIRDFLPIISTEDGHIGEPCLFDIVENKYYYNQGTGTFLTNLPTSTSNVNVTDKGILNCRYLIEGNDPAKVLKDENIIKVNEIKEN